MNLFLSKRIASLAMLFALFVLTPIHGLAQSEGPNLIANPSLEIANAAGTLPQSWNHGQWGSETAIFTYPATPAKDGARAAKVELTAHTTGDAKWYFNEVPVVPGAVYRFSDSFIANVPTVITAQYRMTDGSVVFADVATPQASSTYANAGVIFVTPANVQSLTIFHLINQVGTLTIDNVELHKLVFSPRAPIPPQSQNLFANPSLETANGNAPQSWAQGGFGSNIRQYTYPAPGIDGARAATIRVTQYASGDAKWFPNEVTVSPNTVYTFSDSFTANTVSYVTVQMRATDGTLSYLDLGKPLPSNAAQGFSKTFTTPATVQSLTVFHLLKGVGALTVDSFSLVPAVGSDPSLFSQGIVSLNFDDGLRETFVNGYPIVNASGLKSTQCIISGRFAFPAYDDQNIVLQMQSEGHEVCAHTRTHPHLTTLNATDLQSEVAGSKSDLAAIGAPTTTFAYPFGEYNDTVIQAVKDVGFIGARSTDNGANLRTDNRYTLKRMDMKDTTAIADVEAAIDAAVANRQWLILVFHHVNSDDSAPPQDVTPEFLQTIVNYLLAKKVRVVTNSEGLQLMMAP